MGEAMAATSSCLRLFCPSKLLHWLQKDCQGCADGRHAEVNNVAVIGDTDIHLLQDKGVCYGMLRTLAVCCMGRYCYQSDEHSRNPIRAALQSRF